VEEEAAAARFLTSLGAGAIAHPGGTLLGHLRRVHALLASWGARPDLQLAGLCHAFYGTDGFPTALLTLDRRAELAAVIGPEAEQLVYDYAACDRKLTYGRLADYDPVFHDRFTGRAYPPSIDRRRDFAELTAANELDLVRVNRDFRAQWGPELLGLFTRFRPLLSEPAWKECLRACGSTASTTSS
jgi:hypothetical protein